MNPRQRKRLNQGQTASVVCSRCQKTLHEQEVARLLQGSTAEPVTCDACLYSASQTLSQEITTGKGKATRKRTRPGEAAPEPKRGKSQPGKEKTRPWPSRPTCCEKSQVGKSGDRTAAHPGHRRGAGNTGTAFCLQDE